MVRSLLRHLARRALDAVARARHRPLPAVRYRQSMAAPPRPIGIEVVLATPAITAVEASQWCARQTLRELRVVALDRDGTELWRVDAEGPASSLAGPAAFFAAPVTLPVGPAVDASRYEAALYVLLGEEIDGLWMSSAVGVEDAPPPGRLDEVVALPHRHAMVFRRGAFRHDPATAGVEAKKPRRVKVASIAASHQPYLTRRRPRTTLEVSLRDLAQLTSADLAPRRGERPTVLVTAPFLARGGAEHTLFETLRHLRDRFDFTLVTLAPHRPELGDRRAEFAAEVSPHLLPLGDLVHPDAMPGILLSLLERTGAEVLYNANGTTLFYDFAPRLRAALPRLRIVDHLYDHRVGYVDRYRPELLSAIDVCVAENQRIHEVLTTDRGWPAERVPVIWPCGRREDAFPPPAERTEVRRRRRGELGIAEDDVVVLTAARMHPQKRPLDLVALAARLVDLPRLRFLVVGGGELEGEVDAAIAATPEARIARLAFRDDVPEILVAADIGCLVSAYEGLPVFLLECLQAGRPFVGTDAGEIATVLERSGAGIVSGPPGDLDALEAALRHLADDTERERLARRAALAGAELGVAACAERYAEVFAGRSPRR